MDTASYGLRILASVPTISLPVQTLTNGDSLLECTQFVDRYSWGPVALADVQISGETANSLPVQVIGAAGFPTVPAVVNPITAFATDQNGVIIQLPSVAAQGAATVTGYMIFGIDTQANNKSGSQSVLTVDPNSGYLTTVFNGQPLAQSFSDPSLVAFPTLAGPYVGTPPTFDWGLPFYFGRTVYTAMENAATSVGTRPYVAF